VITITIPAADKNYHDWTDPNSNLSYQGALQAPNVCSGGSYSVDSATFQADVRSDDTEDPINIQFHYKIPSANTQPNDKCTLAYGSGGLAPPVGSTFCNGNPSRPPSTPNNANDKDMTAPSCGGFVAAPPTASGQKVWTMQVQDADSGLAAVNVLSSSNVDINIPSFAQGKTTPETVTITQHTVGVGGHVALSVVDTANNKNSSAGCDPVFLSAARDPGKPVTQTVDSVLQGENTVTITNGNPGLTSLRIDVNGTRFEVGGLKDGEVRNVDIGAALQAGTNTVSFTALGKPGGSAAILVHP
jgi:hypothetical protein